MARKTDGEKIDELDKVVAGMLNELANINKLLDGLRKDIKDLSFTSSEFRQLHERQYTALAKETDEYRRWSEKNGTAEVKADLALLKEKTNKLDRGSPGWKERTAISDRMNGYNTSSALVMLCVCRTLTYIPV